MKLINFLCTAAVYQQLQFLQLADVGPGELTFNWNAVAPNCPAVEYNITTNCGNCPATTRSPKATCSIELSSSAVLCSFEVQTMVCGDVLIGTVTALLKVM